MSVLTLHSNGLASSTYKNLSRTQSSLNANIQRLSSGLRINSTADDSAGSNVTVRMSNQVSGMAQANRNTQEANNLLAAAESGLSDISDILSKMRELSVQAATDTLNDNDRSSIDLEFQSLKDELTRIANVTEYNGMNVLNGTYQEGGGRGQWRIQIGADNDINNQHEFSVMNATANGLDLNYTTYSDSYHSYNLAEFEAAVRDGNLTGKVYVDGSGEITFDDDTAGDVLSWDATANSDAGALVANSKVITGIGTDDSDPAVWLVSDAVEAVAADADAGIAEIQAADSTFSSAIDTSISNENRYESGAFDTTTYYYDANVGSVDAARSAVTHLDAAIDEINRERSYVGSEQNKLQFTMSNLTSNIQSIESARSSIEDVDFAAEAADLAKNQILAQSATAMLAQAAMISQNFLGLLA